MEVRAGGPSGCPDGTEFLPLPNRFAFAHIDPRQMQERARQSETVIDHQQIALERERRFRGQDHHAVRRRGNRRAGGERDIDARMIGTRFAGIDSLRAEQRRDAASCRPGERLAPALRTGLLRAGGSE